MQNSLIIQKYGGSSVANTDRIKNVANRIAKYKKKGHKVVVIVSALGDTTDELLELAGQITDKPSDRELDMLISTGEQVSAALLAMALHKIGVDAISFTGPQVGIITDRIHTKAKILKISADRIAEQVKKGKVVIVAGFQGMNADQEITTLGRGGSDLTAVAIATTLKADACEIYTDVEGVYTADPRIVKDAKKLSRISYEEMLELASLGAQVMQARSMEVAKKYSVPLHIRSSFTDKEGTIISKEVKAMEDVLVSGVTANKGEAKVTICDVPDRPGIAADIFEALSDKNICVDMIIQSSAKSSPGSPVAVNDISFTVKRSELASARKILESVRKKMQIMDIMIKENIAKVSIVGSGMKTHSGVASRLFRVLAKNKINIEMISTSEIKISCVIDGKNTARAVKAIAGEFKL
ncbi:MAG: aspartate kinase [Candidatus Omnitrophica bacterium CG_4_9_14_0_2_um_filter_42_8]|nr:MAG: aspartate kinase [Candidatus Omnitrophica bacterium CG_4_9_14_0_2_um_filter_42_8]